MLRNFDDLFDRRAFRGAGFCYGSAPHFIASFGGVHERSVLLQPATARSMDVPQPFSPRLVCDWEDFVRGK